jgi:hypothetical protein
VRPHGVGRIRLILGRVVVVRPCHFDHAQPAKTGPGTAAVKLANDIAGL